MWLDRLVAPTSDSMTADIAQTVATPRARAELFRYRP
jgi:hypothetical protein